MAVRCWCLKFLSADHVFLHKSHVFSNISKILSKSEEEWEETANAANNLAQVGIRRLFDLCCSLLPICHVRMHLLISNCFPTQK